ncbi:Glucose-6-phosphate 1-dehydrogenase [Verrucomicrobia bacterium]|nr:Glucose-6-phosphate 1-dehydrogenase [Verrucomicrobiota bacterium]
MTAAAPTQDPPSPATLPPAGEEVRLDDDPPILPADPCIMVIFGATGDLTKRKLIPALCNLASSHLLTDQFAIIGLSYNDLSTENFRQQVSEEIKQFAISPVPPEIWEWFLKRIYYVRGDFKDPACYQRLKEQLAEVEQTHRTQGNYFYYLAVAPAFFGEIVRQLGTAGLAQESAGHWRRVVIEKPFGRDLDSARALNAEIKQVLEEHQIYRIDHYLGKETVQNIMMFRFGNGIFEPIWNRRYIDHVQITSGETVGVELRGGYYETAGALRDMVPNHLFQLVSLTAMEPPISFHADAVRDEQAKVLHAIQAPAPEDVLRMAVRGQYDRGQIGNERVPAYRAEPNVAPNSTTETFVALKLKIDNWRWADVPFYLRTGKRLAKRTTEITIQFRRAPFQLFRHTSVERLHTNRLVLHIQPDEGLSLRFGAKVPGPVMRMGAVEMNFNYVDYFGSRPSTGYERLLYDCMIGDATLFQRADMVEAGWSVITPVLDVWKALPPRNFPNYPAGSWGPKEADELLAKDGREWRNIE